MWRRSIHGVHDDTHTSADGPADDVLLAAIRAGEPQVFSELFLRYYRPLCRFARAICRRWEVAEEVVSLVFDDLWKRRRDLTITTSLKAYLYGAVRNQAINRAKTLQRHPTAALHEQSPDDFVDANSSLSDILLQEVHQEVEQMVAQLPAQRQLIFRMNRFDGLRYKEIAEVLGLSEHTVQAHMVLAVRQLAPNLPRLRALIQR